jgi:hypothetical protein
VVIIGLEEDMQRSLQAGHNSHHQVNQVVYFAGDGTKAIFVCTKEWGSPEKQAIKWKMIQKKVIQQQGS